MGNSVTDIEIGEDEFHLIINNSHKLVVVHFFAEWCMPCLMLFPIIEDIAQKIKEVKFVKVNAEDNEELKKKCNVSTMPCLVIYKEGKEIERLIGNNSAEVIEKKILECMC